MLPLGILRQNSECSSSFQHFFCGNCLHLRLFWGATLDFFSINQYMFKTESIDYFEKIISTKGQIISKCLFGVFNFFKKTNENSSHTSKNEFIRSFFGRIHGLTICFRNELTFKYYTALLKNQEYLKENYVSRKYKHKSLQICNTFKCIRKNNFCVHLGFFPPSNNF